MILRIHWRRFCFPCGDLRLTEVNGDVGFQGRLGLRPRDEVLSVLRGALGALGAVHLVRGGVLADPAVAGRRGPEGRAGRRVASTQEGAEEVIVCLFGRLQHLLGDKP